MRLIPWQKWSYLWRAINYGVRFLIISLLLFLGTTLLLTSPAQAQTIVPATLPEATTGVSYSILSAVWGQGPPLRFLTFSLPEATEGSPYTGTISAQGGTPPYTWSIIGGALPSGLSLDAATGTISGTPTQGTAGSYGFTVRVTDSSTPALSAQQFFTITVKVKKGFYDAIITISSSLLAGETKVLVDGKEVAKLVGGQSIRLVFPLGTRHTVAIEQEVLHPQRPDIKFKADKDVITIDEFSPTAIFNYDIYYQLTVTSPHGKTEGSGWYKANTKAKWSVAPTEIPMSGILGFFGGKLKPDYHSGIEVMDAPKIVTVTWKSDTTIPIILISLLVLFTAGAAFIVYRLLRPRPEETYRKRPDLGKARRLRGVWIMMPRRRRKRYKKFSRRIPIRLTPHKVVKKMD